jgi:hypothetical protein
MPAAGFETGIPANERPQFHALDHVATVNGFFSSHIRKYRLLPRFPTKLNRGIRSVLKNAIGAKIYEDRWAGVAQNGKGSERWKGKSLKWKLLRTSWSLIWQEQWGNLCLTGGISQVGDKNEKAPSVAGDRDRPQCIPPATDRECCCKYNGASLSSYTGQRGRINKRVNCFVL